MKNTLILSIFVLSFCAPAYADIYQWIDDSGVVSFTDKPETIPVKYRNKVKIISTEDSDQGGIPSDTATPVAQPDSSAGSATQPSQQRLYGGHDERWWRSQYGSIRGELAQLQGTLPAKRAELEQLRRKLVIYTFARNRVAYQEKLAEIQRDEDRIQTLTKQLQALDLQAASAGVPFDWRQ